VSSEGCCFCGTVYSRLKLHRVSDPLQKMDKLPGVSVVKPLMGVDPFLETNLESHFTLDYPKVRCHLAIDKLGLQFVNIVINK